MAGDLIFPGLFVSTYESPSLENVHGKKKHQKKFLMLGKKNKTCFWYCLQENPGVTIQIFDVLLPLPGRAAAAELGWPSAAGWSRCCWMVQIPLDGPGLEGTSSLVPPHCREICPDNYPLPRLCESKAGATISIQVLCLLKGTTQLVHCHMQLVTTMLAHLVKLFFFSLCAANWTLILESCTPGVSAARRWSLPPPREQGRAFSTETWRTVVTSQIKDGLCDQD